MEIEDLLCFAVYAAGHAFTRAYRPVLARLGLTYPQFLVMVALWRADAVTVGELGERLALETSTLTPLLKRLEAMGLLTRRRAAEDERRVVVRLTDAGRDLRHAAADVPACILAATGLTREGAAALTRDLRDLRANLEKAAGELPAPPHATSR